jgi:hypothetical protein
MVQMKLIPIVIVAVILILILSYPVPPRQGRFIVDLLDAGHAPLFGVAALVLLRLAPRERKGTLREYLVVLFLATILGILTELVQRVEGGDAEVKDVVDDILGAASFLMIHWTVRHRSSASFCWLLRLTSMAVLVAVVWPPMLSGMATFHRDRAFPVILDFNSVWDSRWCRPDGAVFEIAPAPPRAGQSVGNRMGRITFEPFKLSIFLIDETHPNWTGYREFVFTVYSELSTVVQLELNLYDRQYRKRDSDSYHTLLTINPGMNTIRIPLADVERGPATRRMEMTSMYRIALSAIHPKNRFSVYLDALHLE